MKFSDVVKLYKEGIKPKDLKDMIEVKKEFDALEEENPEEINSILGNEDIEHGNDINYRELYEKEKEEKENLTLELAEIKDKYHILTSENENNKNSIKELQASLSRQDISDNVNSDIDINKVIKDNL